MMRRLVWQLARVAEVRPETAHAATLALDVPDWPGHQPGQHVDLRLTAPDGYQAQRSYSIASAPDAAHVELTVERLEDGEVSPYLVGDVRAGDELELRGPIGGYFVWRPELGGPLLLVAGGSGIVPLMAMLRQHAAAGSDVPARMLLSARTRADVLYAAELERLARPGTAREVHVTLTRERPADWTGLTGRVDSELLADLAWPAPDAPLAYVCGPTSFVEAVAGALVDLGHDPARVKTERFGPTGG